MSPSPVRVFHNARCSKSRSACALLAERGVELEVVDYLRTPPTQEELRALLTLLGMRAEALVRKGEDVFRDHYAGRSLTEEEWLEALVAHPILMERPIVVYGNRAVVARPPELALELLG